MTYTRYSLRAKFARGLLIAALPFSSVFGPLLPSGAQGAADQTRPPMPVNAAEVGAEEVTESIQIVGTLVANESVVLRPEISGRIVGVHFEEGANADEGDLLFSIEASDYEARVKQHGAEVRLAQLKFDRAKNLRSDQAISQQEFDESESRLIGAKAIRDESKAQLNKATIRAPFDGILGLRQISKGAYVQPGQDLVNLENINPLKVDFKVSERFASVLGANEGFELLVDAFPDERFVGAIHAIDPRLDPATRTFVIRGKVENSEGKLRPGMFARIFLTVGHREQAITVPEEAVFPVADQLYVYRLIEGKAVKTLIQTGSRMIGKVEVKKGLSAGDRVITAGHLKIRDGADVVAIP